MRKKYRFKLNGKNVEIEAAPAATLLKVLRDGLGIRSVKEGCGRGDCGACTVIMNGRAVHSCLTIMEQVDGAEIMTVEGLTRDEKLDVLQRAFAEVGAVQCGYCTPGILMASKYLLTKNPNPDLDEVREALRGNLCRCTGYQSILEAVRRASK